MNDGLLLSYLPIFMFLVIAFGLATVMILIPFFVARVRGDTEKSSAYECGFESFGDSRMPFDVRFYLVSILFIIFDLEIAFLFPWAITLNLLPELGFWSMMFFLFILAVGFIYEWRRGALEWK
ncbi:MAG: NADH-quinone oxidoreductase subunit A [Candidatus Jidaibacter sp.]|jgi:NADH-quinone oxidoreductase subunit A|nr:NADH-quinone oxidoreductase subunit A [Candidatus Jidaibacter sp.]